MLDTAVTLLIFKLVMTLGLAVWASISVINNIQAFAASAAAIARTMSMEALDQSPRIATPLRTRALRRRAWSIASLLVILSLQASGAIALILAVLNIGRSLLLGTSAAEGLAMATAGLSALTAAWLVMLCGGLWFAYWIRQEGLQLTHLTLLAVTLASVIVLHL